MIHFNHLPSIAGEKVTLELSKAEKEKLTELILLKVKDLHNRVNQLKEQNKKTGHMETSLEYWTNLLNKVGKSK